MTTRYGQLRRTVHPRPCAACQQNIAPGIVVQDTAGAVYHLDCQPGLTLVRLAAGQDDG